MTWILNSDWSILVTWPEYWPVIGPYWSLDLNTDLLLVNTDHVTLILDLWLVNTDHVTTILISDWSILITWPEYWSLIGQDPRYSVQMSDSSSTLTVTLVRREDAGQLTCQVASTPPMEQTFNIEIKGGVRRTKYFRLLLEYCLDAHKVPMRTPWRSEPDILWIIKMLKTSL